MNIEDVGEVDTPAVDVAPATEHGNPAAVSSELLQRLDEQLGAVTRAIDSLDRRLDRIEADFVGRFKSDDKLQTAFDRLYEELVQYKENFLFQAQKPLLVDLIMLHDYLETVTSQLSQEDAARSVIEAATEQLLEVLYRRDVEPMDFDERAPFDRDRMKAVRRIDTTDAAVDKTVERLIRRGFSWNERVLRPHEVVVRRLIAD